MNSPMAVHRRSEVVMQINGLWISWTTQARVSYLMAENFEDDIVAFLVGNELAGTANFAPRKWLIRMICRIRELDSCRQIEFQVASVFHRNSFYKQSHHRRT